ncbi:response regulator transcription factor [Faecalibaculum rodentium]|uniref:response regulator transcription factor n=1 Tax=Faecalibaculum rodentium TaxID=1702221 RepID=UPI0023F17F2E|nr:response regulator [Faecalibaculum rodentium]
MRICIVEDNRELASVIRDALDPTECQICCTCRQGLAECEKRWDLLLLDVRLPDGSGLDIARAARIVSDIPILFLSSDGMETTMLEAFESGCDDYIVKPVRLAVLRKKWRHCFTEAGTGLPCTWEKQSCIQTLIV